jgi:hypothetical protein
MFLATGEIQIASAYGRREVGQGKEKKRARQSSLSLSERRRRLTEAHPLDIVEMIDDPKPRAVAVVLDPAGATRRRTVGGCKAVGDDLCRREGRTFRGNKHRGSRSQYSGVLLLLQEQERKERAHLVDAPLSPLVRVHCRDLRGYE